MYVSFVCNTVILVNTVSMIGLFGFFCNTDLIVNTVYIIFSLTCLQYSSNSQLIVYDRSVWFVYSTVLIVNTMSIIGLSDLSTIRPNNVYDRSVWLVYNRVLIVSTVSMIGLFDLYTIQF